MIKQKKYNINFKQLLKQNPFILAPMDDVTDIGFRELCENYDCLYSVSELNSIEAIIRDKTLKSRFEKGNLKINCIQLFGQNIESFVKAAKKIEKYADIIDLNFGCPSPNVTNQKSGAFLLDDIENIGKIVKSVVNAVNIPVTAKIRLGYKNKTYLNVAKEIEKAGASLIVVHGRTAKQKYSGIADWEAIKKVHEHLKIPVIGNGDIKTEQDIDKYLGSHCSGLMIGRAAIGNPLIFKKFYYYYKNKKILEIPKTIQSQKKIFFEYIEKLDKYDFYNLNLKIQRQAMWFFKGINGVKQLREKLGKTKSYKEVLKIIETEIN